VEEVMALVGLSHIAGRLIGDAALPGLSQGQLKLVTIAVELVANPSVIFLDEPTSGLDAPSAARVMKAVKRIAATGRTVLCTIHRPFSMHRPARALSCQLPGCRTRSFHRL
jgi:ABC-type multidrug transport system ATPase subunit